MSAVALMTRLARIEAARAKHRAKARALSAVERDARISAVYTAVKAGTSTNSRHLRIARLLDLAADRRDLAQLA